jgi:hypothetical protein
MFADWLPLFGIYTTLLTLFRFCLALQDNHVHTAHINIRVATLLSILSPWHSWWFKTEDEALSVAFELLLVSGAENKCDIPDRMPRADSAVIVLVRALL